MQSHGPKRVYTPQSLEFWFDKLAVEWEASFSASQLEEGRRLYRDGEVRELEITHHDAIVHRRIDKHDQYAVIEWSEKGMSVRSSSTDVEIAHALAVAGLHEIEELVADEISPLPDAAVAAGNGAKAVSIADKPPHAGGPVSSTPKLAFASPRAGISNGAASSGTFVARTSQSAAGTTSVASSKSASVTTTIHVSQRTLRLVFKTRTSGLTFTANWVEADGKTLHPALGKAAHVDASSHIGSSERSKLIGLAAYARKAHFGYDQESGVYTMQSLVEIPNFLKTVMPAWRKLFSIELDDKAENLLKGTRTVEIEAVAERHAGRAKGGDSATNLNLRWIFRAGERLLTEAEVTALTKHGGAPTIIPSIGIVALPADKLEAYRSWQQNVNETQGEGPLSPYLIFSLFNEARLKLTLSPEIEEWRRRVLAAPSESPSLPELLRPYQRRGVEWLHHMCEVNCHGLLADEMGLGKTLQVLSLLASRPILDLPGIIVCPASVVPVWCEEIAKFFPHIKVEVLKGAHDFVHCKGNKIWLSSYTQLRKHRDILPQVEFGYAVLDEGQFIKNPDAKTTQTCFALKARHRIVLTGTPLENRQLDLWSIFRFLLPGLLGSRHGFESALNTDRSGTLDRLRAQLAPFILRRTKNEVAQELPPKVEMDLI